MTEKTQILYVPQSAFLDIFKYSSQLKKPFKRWKSSSGAPEYIMEFKSTLYGVEYLFAFLIIKYNCKITLHVRRDYFFHVLCSRYAQFRPNYVVLNKGQVLYPGLRIMACDIGMYGRIFIYLFLNFAKRPGSVTEQAPLHNP